MYMVFEMKLSKIPFELIRNGRKTVELRLYDDKRKQLNINDLIIFTSLSDEVEKIAVRIKALYRYASFEELFSEIEPVKCGYEADISIEEAVVGMRKYYSEENEKQYGVLGIKVECTSLEDALLVQKRIQEAEFERLFPDGMK